MQKKCDSQTAARQVDVKPAQASGSADLSTEVITDRSAGRARQLAADAMFRVSKLLKVMRDAGEISPAEWDTLIRSMAGLRDDLRRCRPDVERSCEHAVDEVCKGLDRQIEGTPSLFQDNQFFERMVQMREAKSFREQCFLPLKTLDEICRGLFVLEDGLQAKLNLEKTLDPVRLMDGRLLLAACPQTDSPQVIASFLRQHVEPASFGAAHWKPSMICRAINAAADRLAAIPFTVKWAAQWAPLKARIELGQKLLTLQKGDRAARDLLARRQPAVSAPHPKALPRAEAERIWSYACDRIGANPGPDRSRFFVMGISGNAHALFFKQLTAMTAALSGVDLDDNYWLDCRAQPERLAEKKIVALSYVGPGCRDTCVDGGFVVYVPPANILVTSPSDWGGPTYADAGWSAQQAEASDRILGPDTLLDLSRGHNEVNVMGTHPTSGAQVKVIGVFLRTDAHGRPKLPKEKVREWLQVAHDRGLPVEHIADENVATCMRGSRACWRIAREIAALGIESNSAELNGWRDVIKKQTDYNTDDVMRFLRVVPSHSASSLYRLEMTDEPCALALPPGCPPEVVPARYMLCEGRETSRTTYRRNGDSKTA